MNSINYSDLPDTGDAAELLLNDSGKPMGYRDLQIWQLARDMTVVVHRMSLEKLPRFELHEEGSQIRRSAKSVRSRLRPPPLQGGLHQAPHLCRGLLRRNPRSPRHPFRDRFPDRQNALRQPLPAVERTGPQDQPIHRRRGTKPPKPEMIAMLSLNASVRRHPGSGIRNPASAPLP